MGKPAIDGWDGCAISPGPGFDPRFLAELIVSLKDGKYAIVIANSFSNEGSRTRRITRNAVEYAETKRPFVRRNKRDRAAKRDDW